MLTVKFYYRGSSRGDEYEGRLVIRLTRNRKVSAITTRMCIYRQEWDHQSQQFRWDGKDPGRKEYLEKLSRQMEKKKERLLTIATELDQADGLDLKMVACLYRQDQTDYSWPGILKLLSAELRELGQLRTAEAYSCSVRRLLSFADKQMLTLKETDSLLIRRFEKRLLEERKSLNTISFYMRNLRAMLGKAVKKGLVRLPEENLFAEVFTGVEVTRKRAIAKEELSRLNQLFHDESSSLTKGDRNALGFFLFSFHARGMSFVDLAHLKKENLWEDQIRYVRRKTGKLMEVELNPELKKFLRYFSKQSGDSPYLLPILKHPVKKEMKAYYGALRLQNRYLKHFNLSSGQSLSTHMARHSWATIAKGENISLRVISECLGHSSEKTTQIYLASFERSVLDDANRRVIRALHKAV